MAHDNGFSSSPSTGPSAWPAQQQHPEKITAARGFDSPSVHQPPPNTACQPSNQDERGPPPAAELATGEHARCFKAGFCLSSVATGGLTCSETRQASNIISFPPRRNVVWLTRQCDGWQVLVGSHGWLHGSSSAAEADARWLAQNFQIPVRWVST
jgi:hypothetical protein